jgi:hypothetical protein
MSGVAADDTGSDRLLKWLTTPDDAEGARVPRAARRATISLQRSTWKSEVRGKWRQRKTKRS